MPSGTQSQPFRSPDPHPPLAAGHAIDTHRSRRGSPHSRSVAQCCVERVVFKGDAKAIAPVGIGANPPPARTELLDEAIEGEALIHVVHEQSPAGLEFCPGAFDLERVAPVWRL